MILSFVAVVSFLVVVAINSYVTPYESFAYVSTSQRETGYASLASGVEANVKASHNSAEADKTALFLNSTIEELNLAINYFEDYLSLEGNLSKKEQSTLTNQYKKYNFAFKTAVDAYNAYCAKFADIVSQEGAHGVHNWTHDEINVLEGLKRSFLKKYGDCYNKGSAFCKSLSSMVLAKRFANAKNYKNLVMIFKIAYADCAVNDLVGGETIKLPAQSDFAASYAVFCSNCNNFSDAQIFCNTNLKNFVCNVNQIDVFAFVADYEAYYNSLDDVHKQIAQDVKTFLQENF